MKALIPGHRYQLDSFEGESPQVLQFIQKEQVGAELQTVVDGTSNEEVIKMLIDRLQYLQEKLPSPENNQAINKLYEALFYLEHRTKDRKERGVEGTPLP